MKMYGFAYAMGHPCICFGKKGWFFKLIWSPVKKRPMWYSWWSDTSTIWRERVNSYPFRFFGLFILPHENMKVMRCKKLGGKKVPRSCHVLNGRKEHCDDLFETDEQEEIKMFEL